MQGQMVGEYELREELGSGSFGTVWKAKHRSADSWRAVKVAKDPALVEQFRREFEVLDRLEHNHIVRVYDLVTSGDAPAIIFEYVEGTDLENLLKQSGQLPWRQAVDITLQVLDGLGVAHEAGLLHRDIKPSNILLTTDGRVKIADFGLVAAAERSGSVDWSQRSASSHRAGTAHYMAPEMDEHGLATARSDLYSLGVVLYRCLTGRLPQGMTRPASSYGCPPALDELLTTLLAPEPETRPVSATETLGGLKSASHEADTYTRAIAEQAAQGETVPTAEKAWRQERGSQREKTERLHRGCVERALLTVRQSREDVERQSPEAEQRTRGAAEQERQEEQRRRPTEMAPSTPVGAEATEHSTCEQDTPVEKGTVTVTELHPDAVPRKDDTRRTINGKGGTTWPLRRRACLWVLYVVFLSAAFLLSALAGRQCIGSWRLLHVANWRPLARVAWLGLLALGIVGSALLVSLLVDAAYKRITSRLGHVHKRAARPGLLGAVACATVLMTLAAFIAVKRPFLLPISPASAHSYRGQEHLFKGEYEKALAEYDEALKIDPLSSAAHAGRGIAQERMGQYAFAVEDLTKAIQSAPSGPMLSDSLSLGSVYFQRGNAYYESRQYHLAIQDYSKAIELSPGFAQAYYARGATYSQLSQSGLSQADASQAKQLGNTDDWFGLYRQVLPAAPPFVTPVECQSRSAEVKTPTGKKVGDAWTAPRRERYGLGATGGVHDGEQ